VVALSFYILYLVRDLLIWFIFALIISILFNPLIDFCQRRRIPRVVTVISIYVSAFALLSFLIYFSSPLFISEIQQFTQLFPQYFEKISPPLRGLGVIAFENLEAFTDVLGKTLEKMAGNIFQALFSFFGGIFITFFIITIAIFLSLEEKAVERSLSLLFPKKYEAYVLDLWGRCQSKVVGWFGARMLGCIFVGGLCYLAFVLFGVKYPFFLALMAGILEFIPIIGPLVAGIVAFLFVSLDSMVKAIFVLIFFVLVQQIEGNILTPILTKKFIGLPPALVLVALAVGGKLWGVLGAILTIPLAGLLFEFVRDFLKKKREEKAVVL
jgi:predicted PurR-regulated permease PerM